MTGPEHYRAAERLLERAGEYSAHDGDKVQLIQRAQVHADLAKAAALGALLADRYVGDNDNVNHWLHAITIERHV